MKWLDNIKRTFGESLLKKKLKSNRKSAVHNFNDARSVGILYREKGESFYILVKQYVKYLQDEHGIREIMALAYIDDKKEVPFYQIHKLKYDYFTKGELDWRFEPHGEVSQNFIAKEFDILIDFEKEPVLPLRFVLAQSKAQFKVGYYDKANEPFYDLMFETKEDGTFDDYIKQINHYLKLINTA